MQEPPSPVLMKKMFLLFYCIPVSPGNSRLIFASPRNFGVWIDRVVPRWLFHIGQNLILDSDLYLLHVEVNFNSFFYELHFIIIFNILRYLLKLSTRILYMIIKH